MNLNDYPLVPPTAQDLGARLAFFFSSRRRHTRFDCDWSSDVCSSDLGLIRAESAAVLDRRFKVGERLEIMPNHSCLTVAHFDQYHVVRDGRVVDQIGRASCRERV